jgi:hypothetical protein
MPLSPDENLWQKLHQQQQRQSAAAPSPAPAAPTRRPALWQRLYHAPLHWKLLLSSQLIFTIFMLDYRHRLVQKRLRELDQETSAELPQLQQQQQQQQPPQYVQSAVVSAAATTHAATSAAPPRQKE